MSAQTHTALVSKKRLSSRTSAEASRTASKVKTVPTTLSPIWRGLPLEIKVRKATRCSGRAPLTAEQILILDMWLHVPEPRMLQQSEARRRALVLAKVGNPTVRQPERSLPSASLTLRTTTTSCSSSRASVSMAVPTSAGLLREASGRGAPRSLC